METFKTLTKEMTKKQFKSVVMTFKGSSRETSIE